MTGATQWEEKEFLEEAALLALTNQAEELNREFNISEKEPRSLFNVLVCHTIHHQDFWTRGFLSGQTWTVMTWSGQVEVPKSAITRWKYLPSKKLNP